MSSSLDRIASGIENSLDDKEECLVFTCPLLHKPSWVVMVEALVA